MPSVHNYESVHELIHVFHSEHEIISCPLFKLNLIYSISEWISFQILLFSLTCKSEHNRVQFAR